VAGYARALQGVRFDLSDREPDPLLEACLYHSDGLVEADPTVQACRDADRLDLGRVGIRPDPGYLCTDHARRPEVRWPLLTDRSGPVGRQAAIRVESRSRARRATGTSATDRDGPCQPSSYRRGHGALRCFLPLSRGASASVHGSGKPTSTPKPTRRPGFGYIRTSRSGAETGTSHSKPSCTDRSAKTTTRVETVIRRPGAGMGK